MPKSLNKVQLIGNLGKDPDTKYTQAGDAVSQFSIATGTPYKDRDGQWSERTEWHQITCWKRLAEIAQEYLHKGSKVYIEGRLETQSWDDKKSGEKKYKTVIIAHDLIMLDGKQDGGERQERGESRSESESRSDSRSTRSAARPVTEEDPIDSSDIPF